MCKPSTLQSRLLDICWGPASAHACLTNTAPCLQVLKSKRMYENQLGALTNQQFNVEQTNFALQSMQDNVETVRAMQAAGKQLKQNFKQPELNINKIENMQDDMADLMVRFTDMDGNGSGQHCSRAAFRPVSAR